MRTTVGIDPASIRYYKGPLPNDPAQPYEGAADFWLYGMSWQTYINGGYTNTEPCFVLPPMEFEPEVRIGIEPTAQVAYIRSHSPTVSLSVEATAERVVIQHEEPTAQVDLTASPDGEILGLATGNVNLTASPDGEIQGLTTAEIFITASPDGTVLGLTTAEIDVTASDAT